MLGILFKHKIDFENKPLVVAAIHEVAAGDGLILLHAQLLFQLRGLGTLK